MQSLKKVLWISDIEGWAYSNRFNAIRKSSEFDHVQVLTTGLPVERIRKLIKDQEADIIMVQNQRGFYFLDTEDWWKAITLYTGKRGLSGWER